jgi:hypothetical protein
MRGTIELVVETRLNTDDREQSRRRTTRCKVA